MPAVLNAANEVAVDAFLDGRIALPESPALFRTASTARRTEMSTRWMPCWMLIGKPVTSPARCALDRTGKTTKLTVAGMILPPSKSIRIGDRAAMPDLSAAQLIIGFLLLLTPVVFFHELGHYWVARRAGVVVEVFSVGFGPEIYGWTSRSTGTRWRIAAIPLGGYVRMRGDETEAGGEAEGASSITGSFAAAGLWWRIAIVAAGLANFILGILLFAMVYMTAGKIFLPAQIGEVIPETAAAEAGLRPGDVITEIDGISVRDFNDMRGLVVESPGRALDFTILRDGSELTLDVTPTPGSTRSCRSTWGCLASSRSVPARGNGFFRAARSWLRPRMRSGCPS